QETDFLSIEFIIYIESIIKKYKYFDYKPARTPYDSSVKLFRNKGESKYPTMLIGALFQMIPKQPRAIYSIAGRVVSWKSKKLTILAQPTTYVEMIALALTSE
ncbi:hypothetical protein Lal_00018108, partial [Lupinus albus]